MAAEMVYMDSEVARNRALYLDLIETKEKLAEQVSRLAAGTLLGVVPF